jgi:hypothetical protein
MNNHADFLQALLNEFPELHENIDACNGLSYIEMGVFARFAQKAKGLADWDTYGRAVRLAADILPNADKDLRNEFYVSFLEHLDFEGPRGQTAWRLLPVSLQRAWHEIIEYNEQLLGRPWVRTKPKISE